MTAIIILFALSTLVLVYSLFPHKRQAESVALHPKIADQLDKLMDAANEAIKEKKTYRAEKALLTVLRFDEKNATAYNRLGILYAKDRKYNEAIDCFEIANGIEPNPASVHNIGTIYYETENYEKAAIYFEQSIEMEGDSANHYTALAKTELKLDKKDRAISALESAYDIQPSMMLLKNIRQIYESMEDPEALESIDARIKAMTSEIDARKHPVRTLRTTRQAERAARPTRPKRIVRLPKTPKIVRRTVQHSTQAPTPPRTPVQPRPATRPTPQIQKPIRQTVQKPVVKRLIKPIKKRGTIE